MRQRLTTLCFANYLTLLFLFGLFGYPSVLNAQTCTGNADVVTSQIGVTNPNNALGVADAVAAELWDTGDQIVLDLTDPLNASAIIVLRWKGNTASTADPTVTIETSANGTTFTAVGGSPFTVTRSATYFDQNITTPSTTRYIRFTTTNTYNIDLDALTFTNQPCSPPVSCVSVGGVSFNDYNQDGVKGSTEQVQSGIIAKVYDWNGTFVSADTTDSNGDWFINGLTFSATNKYRVEFSVPTALSVTGLKPAFNGTGSKTDVQFVATASCAVNFGVIYPADYCQANPRLVTSCYVEGDAPAASDVLVSVAYSPTGTQDNTFPNLSHEGTQAQLGATYGLAYQRQSNTLFAASFQKRHTSFGSANSTGAIYKIVNPSDNATTGVSVFLDLNVLYGSNVVGANPHPTGSNYTTDDASFNKVGKISLGDMDISDDEQSLWTINLSDRKLYKIPLGSDPANPVAPTLTSQISTYPLYNICDCDADGSNDLVTDGDARPFGIKIYKGKIYIGLICNAESTPTVFSNLRAKVFAFDTATAVTTQVLDFPLNYNRGLGYSGATAFPNGIPAGSGYNTSNTANWRPWDDTYSNTEWSWYDAAFREGGYPQPILADIEFDDNGNMLLGLRDRFGDMVGDGLAEPGGATLLESDATGDILRATLNVGGSGWTFSTTEATNGTEFFAEDNLGTQHQETSMGGLAVYRGADRVIYTVMDPVTNISAGFDWARPSTGTLDRSYQVFRRPSGQAGSSDLFAKSNGLGEVELVCNPAPIQIGNFVWKDTDRDGIQDPSETPLSNIALSLWKNNVQIATTTTDANGNYAFTGIGAPNETWTATSGTDSILPNMTYQIRIDTTNQAQLDTLKLTTANATANSGNDQNDADAAVTGNYAVISLTTGAMGSTNHTYDFGFAPTCDTTLTVSNTTICNGSTVNLFAQASGVKGTLTYSTNGTTWTALTNPTNVTPSVSTTYFVKDTLTSGCFDVDTLQITVNQPVTAGVGTNPAAATCQAGSGLANINLAGQITGATVGGTWSQTSGTAVGTALNTATGVFNPNGIAVGTYTFRYTVTGTSPCPNDTEDITITIQTCCPIPICIPLTVTRNTGSN